jgi:hypothetical protein
MTLCPPSSAWTQIAIRRDDNLLKFTWDGRIGDTACSTSDLQSWVTSWVATKDLLESVRPICGQPIENDKGVSAAFRKTFPEFF